MVSIALSLLITVIFLIFGIFNGKYVRYKGILKKSIGWLKLKLTSTRKSAILSCSNNCCREFEIWTTWSESYMCKTYKDPSPKHTIVFQLFSFSVWWCHLQTMRKIYIVFSSAVCASDVIFAIKLNRFLWFFFHLVFDCWSWHQELESQSQWRRYERWWWWEFDIKNKWFLCLRRTWRIQRCCYHFIHVHSIRCNGNQPMDKICLVFAAIHR